MTITEFKNKINTFVEKNNFSDYRLFIMCYSGDVKTRYEIEVRGRKEEPISLKANGVNPEWCLKYLQKLFDLYTESQEDIDIELI